MLNVQWAVFSAMDSFFSNIHNEEVQQYIRIETGEGVSQLDQRFLTATGKVLIYGQERIFFFFLAATMLLLFPKHAKELFKVHVTHYVPGLWFP